MKREDVEACVIRDYEQLRGRLIRTCEVDCSNDSDFETMYLSDPIVLRIDEVDPRSPVILRWMDDVHCDPVYEVELVESNAEADAWLADGDWHVVYVYGPGRTTKGGYEKPRFTVLANSQKEG